jgi:hypothetical protein
VSPLGPASILVSGAPSSKAITSAGGPSLSLSRLLSVCSSPKPSSAASRIWKPWFADAYMARSCCVTFHSSVPSADGTVAAGPVVPGWLLHVTEDSAQAEATWRTSSVRPTLADAASTWRLADATPLHPGGSAGSANRRSARELAASCDFTFSVESLPKLLDGLP